MYERMFGPGQVDQNIRQAIHLCWMMLPDERKNLDALEREIRRVVDRALQDFRNDYHVFQAKKPLSLLPTRESQLTRMADAIDAAMNDVPDSGVISDVQSLLDQCTTVGSELQEARREAALQSGNHLLRQEVEDFTRAVFRFIDGTLSWARKLESAGFHLEGIGKLETLIKELREYKL